MSFHDQVGDCLGSYYFKWEDKGRQD